MDQSLSLECSSNLKKILATDNIIISEGPNPFGLLHFLESCRPRATLSVEYTGSSDGSAVHRL